MNISLSQVYRKSLSSGEIAGYLRHLDGGVIKLDNISEVKAPRWRTEHEQNVTLTPRIAVRKCHIELLDSRMHEIRPNVEVWHGGRWTPKAKLKRNVIRRCHYRLVRFFDSFVYG